MAYLKSNTFSQAVYYLEKYLEINPSQIEMVNMLLLEVKSKATGKRYALDYYGCLIELKPSVKNNPEKNSPSSINEAQKKNKKKDDQQ